MDSLLYTYTVDSDPFHLGNCENFGFSDCHLLIVLNIVAFSLYTEKSCPQFVFQTLLPELLQNSLLLFFILFVLILRRSRSETIIICFQIEAYLMLNR